MKFFKYFICVFFPHLLFVFISLSAALVEHEKLTNTCNYHHVVPCSQPLREAAKEVPYHCIGCPIYCIQYQHIASVYMSHAVQSSINSNSYANFVKSYLQCPDYLDKSRTLVVTVVYTMLCQK